MCIFPQLKKYTNANNLYQQLVHKYGKPNIKLIQIIKELSYGLDDDWLSHWYKKLYLVNRTDDAKWITFINKALEY